MRQLAGRLPAPDAAEAEAGTAAMIRDLNATGLTAFGSAGCPANQLAFYRRAALELFRGDEWVDDIAFGEGVYGPLHDPMFVARQSARGGPRAVAAHRRRG